MIDAACALAKVPSFALFRVRAADGKVNDAAWRGEYEHLRDRIIASAEVGAWTDEDFIKIRDLTRGILRKRLRAQEGLGVCACPN